MYCSSVRQNSHTEILKNNMSILHTCDFLHDRHISSHLRSPRYSTRLVADASLKIATDRKVYWT